MVCAVGSGVIACGPPSGVYRRRMLDCPECDRRHRFVVRWDGAWYGTTLYGACGDRWQDAERAPRPFEKGWREKAQATFRAMWDSAAPVDLYEAYVDADVQFAVGDESEWEAQAQAREAAFDAIAQHRAAVRP